MQTPAIHTHAAPVVTMAVFALLSLGAAVITPARAQVPSLRIRVGPNVHISTAADRVPHVEPHLVVNPGDARHFVVAARVAPPAGDSTVLRVYVSRDGAATWQPGSLAPGDHGGDDPWLTFTPDGIAYLLSLPTVVRRSHDGGRAWTPPTQLPTGEGGSFDYPKLVADATAGTRAGWLYVWTAQARRMPSGRPVGAAALVRSEDRGRTFSWPLPVLLGDIDLQVGAAGVLADGSVIAPFHELGHRRAPLDDPRLWVLRFENGGTLAAGPFLVAEHFRADSPDLAVDRSGGPRDGHVFLSWMQVSPDRSGWNQYVARSEDRGETWSRPQPVHAEPQPTPPYLPHHAMAAVDGRGVLGLTWQQPRAGAGERCFTLVFTASDDGGRTFSEITSVADSPSCNDTPANRVRLGTGDTAIPLVRRFGDGGDYHGLVGLPDGGFLAVWADSRTGVYQLWSARVDVAR